MPREVTVTDDGRRVRAAVGPVAWAILEELVACGDVGPRSVEATTVRRLAKSLGLSKDTIAAGIRRLARNGLVVREDQRDRTTGCFGTSRYHVDAARSGLRPVNPAPALPDPEEAQTAFERPGVIAPRRTPGATGQCGGADESPQLSLLDLGEQA